MTKIISLLRSYGSAANLSEVASRLPAIMIAIWLGVISISMVPRLNIIEGGVVFILFFASCLLVDSVLNPKRLKNLKVGNAIQVIGSRNYKVLIIFHLAITLVLAAHLSFILMKPQIILIIAIGLLLNGINSSYISRKESLNKITSVTSVVGLVLLPMVAAFYVVGNTFDMFSLTIIAGIGLIYLGLETFNQTRNEEGLHCKHCTKECKINIITRGAEKMGYKSFVVPGGAMVFNIAKKYNPKGVVAVACFNELREGTSRTDNEYKVPFQVIPLSKDGCVNTDVSESEVMYILSSIENNEVENT